MIIIFGRTTSFNSSRIYDVTSNWPQNWDKNCWATTECITTVVDGPEAHQQLLCTAVFCKNYLNNAIILNPKSWTIQSDPHQPSQHAINILLNLNNNLPMTVCHQSKSLNKLELNFSKHVTTTHASNFNLSEPLKELPWWHYCLGHIRLRTVQFVIRTGALATSHGATQ